MREILFRGKQKDNYEWCEGFYARYRNKHYIIEMVNELIVNWHEVFPDTVGQYTGLTDKNGKRIFEGDIVDCWSEGVNAKGTVQQRKDGMWIIYPAWQKIIMWSLCPDEHCNTTVVVIGNIHDNPELIGGVSDENA